MPVIDGVLVPRTPLTLAERTVDFDALNQHIEQRRRVTERAGMAPARRVAVALSEFQGLSPLAAVAALAGALERSLQATARFGYLSARRELHQLARATRVRAAYQIQDAGQYSRYAQNGLPGVLALAHRRALAAADAVYLAAYEATAGEPDRILVHAAAVQAASRMLHLRVLELVGETLNMGRTAGALSLRNPPEYAMRSEQLDKNTCGRCEQLHGEIVEVDTSEFYELLPPTGCYGAGRCRGLMVFGYGRADLRIPEAA